MLNNVHRLTKDGAHYPVKLYNVYRVEHEPQIVLHYTEFDSNGEILLLFQAIKTG